MPSSIPDDFTAGGPYTGRIACLYSDGEFLYAGGWHMGVFRTADGGQWSEFNQGLQGYRDVMALAGDGRSLYAGTFGGEVFSRSNDHWTLAHDFGDGPSAVVRAFAIWNGGLLAGTGGGVFFSRDGGRLWTQLWTGQDVSCFSFSPFRHAAFFFGTLGHGLGVCDPGGRNCRLISTYTSGKTIDALAADSSPPAILYVAAEGDGLWGSPDGSTFRSLALHPVAAETYPIALFLQGKKLFISLDGTGLLTKDTATNDWPVKLSFPIAITAIVAHKGRVFFGTDGIGVFAETPRGFAQVNTGLLNFPSEIVEETLRGDPRRGHR